MSEHGPPDKKSPLAGTGSADEGRSFSDPHAEDGSHGAPSKQWAGWVQLPRAILARRDLRPSTKLVYAWLAAELRDGRKKAIGATIIARQTGMSDDAVLSAINQIASAGLVSVRKPAKTGGKSWYELNRIHTQKPGGLEYENHPQIPGGLPTKEKQKHPQKPDRTTRKNRVEPPAKTGCIQEKTLYKTSSGHQPDDARGGSEAKSKEATKTKTTDTHAHRTLVAHWTATWSRLIGGNVRTPFTATDGRHVKTLLAAVAGDIDRAIAIIDRYLADSDPWLSANRPDRPLGTLVSDTRLKKYLAATAAPNRTDSTPAASHPLTQLAEQYFPDDFSQHRDEWMELADAGAPYRELKPGRFASGAEARATLRAKLNGAIAHAS